MIKLRALALLLLWVAAPAAAQQRSAAPLPAGPLRSIEVDRIVAVVGTHAVLFSEILEQINFARANGAQIPEDSLSQLMMAREILGEIVDQEVLVAVSKEYKIDVLDSEVSAQVDQRMRKIREQFESEGEYREALKREGFGSPEEFRKQSLDRAKKAELQKRAVDSLRAKGRIAPANVTESEVADAFEKMKSSLDRRPATIAFRQIVLKPRAGDVARAAAIAKLDSLRVEIEGGAEFDTVAKRESMDQISAALGGDLGWNRRGVMVAEFDRMMFALTPGKLSPIVETAFGFHMIRVDRVRTGEVKARHILITPTVDSADVALARLRADTVVALWKGGTPYDTLIARYHDLDEERSIPEGVPRDSLPAEYRVALENVAANGLTAPFEIPGRARGANKWVVAQVLLRKEAGDYELGEFQERVRQQLREEKAIRRALDTLRREVYVSIRL